MARQKDTFGRRGAPNPATEAPPPARPTADAPVPPRPPGLPIRTRTVAISLVAAGALAATGAHFAGGTTAPACVPAQTTATDGIDDAFGPSGAAANPCPPGTRRTAATSSAWGVHRALNFFSWSSAGSSWSGSSNRPAAGFAAAGTSGGAATTPRFSAAPAAPVSSVSRGGFGSSGSFHFSGGS
jgi:hypothetical protein